MIQHRCQQDKATQAHQHNLISASVHPEVVTAYISEEHKRENIGLVSLLEQAERLNIPLNPLGAIPKKDKPNKWRLIMDLFSPEGYNMNDVKGRL